MTSYPTSPPWAQQAASPAAPVAQPHTQQPYPQQAYLQHGQLLVPYPEAMHNASRAKPPTVWPVAVFTLLFGVLGAISATRRAAQARRGRNSTAPYWIAFGVALVAGGFLSFVAAITVVEPMVADHHERNAVTALQRNLVKDGGLQKTAGLTATSAACTPVDVRGSDGQRDYSCLLKLSDAKTGTIEVTADKAGAWQPVKN
jgi:hypothetical protein